MRPTYQLWLGVTSFSVEKQRNHVKLAEPSDVALGSVVQESRESPGIPVIHFCSRPEPRVRRVTMSLVSLMFTLALTHVVVEGATPVRSACSDAADCSLNGDCVGGMCKCDAAWSGSAACDVMAFEALDRNNPPGYYNKTESSWGGFPVKTEDGGYALVHAQMANGCGLSTWKTNSIVALSKSTSGKVEGPYTFDRELIPPFAHNPTIRRAADGTFVIYFIGSWRTNASQCDGKTSTPRSPLVEPAEGDDCNGMNWPKSCGSDMPGPMGDCCGPENADYKGNSGCGISMASSKSLSGPWDIKPLKIVDQFDSDEVYCAHTNPSPVFLPNGTVVVAFNAGFCHNHLETIGIASAPHWSGPYTLLDRNAVLRNDDGSPHHCEDPHLWKSERGWHLLTHNQQGPQGVASYGFSKDGRNWTLSKTTPYNCTLRYTDGTTAEATGCGNRPQLVFSDEAAAGGAPQWLINGAEAAKPDKGSGTWTLFRKIKTEL